jgi:hypothetical protein
VTYAGFGAAFDAASQGQITFPDSFVGEKTLLLTSLVQTWVNDPSLNLSSAW